jgi:diguanylate cyclase (GGDEF)-like protein
MAGDTMHEIVGLCLALDTKAADAYGILSDVAPDAELSAFWRKMRGEESRHVRFWKKLSKLTSQGIIPQVFDDPDEVIGELRDVMKKVDVMVDACRDAPGVSNSFLLAYRMEFCMMHSAFGTLFHFVKLVTGDKTPEDDYEKHIDGFIKALGKFGHATPELELLAETIKRLWVENKKLVSSNNTDVLTGVMNRRGLMNVINPLSHLAQRNGNNVAVLMVDIDNFKGVNDNHGHLVGDMVLRSVACTIGASIRVSDVVGRYGGEEFVVFMPEVDPEALPALAEMIRLKVEELKVNGLKVTVSVGASQGILGMDTDRDLRLLIGRADEGMYKAKRTGRNKVELC